MEIKILGTGCPNCLALEKKVRNIVKEHSIDAKITMVKDILQIMSYNVMSTPTLVIDEEIVVRGRIPKDSELLALISANNH